VVCFCDRCFAKYNSRDDADVLLHVQLHFKSLFITERIKMDGWMDRDIEGKFPSSTLMFCVLQTGVVEETMTCMTACSVGRHQSSSEPNHSQQSVFMATAIMIMMS